MTPDNPADLADARKTALAECEGEMARRFQTRGASIAVTLSHAELSAVITALRARPAPSSDTTARAEALEEAARIAEAEARTCKDTAEGLIDSYEITLHHACGSTALDVATAIRAAKSAPPDPLPASVQDGGGEHESTRPPEHRCREVVSGTRNELPATGGGPATAGQSARNNQHSDDGRLAETPRVDTTPQPDRDNDHVDAGVAAGLRARIVEVERQLSNAEAREKRLLAMCDRDAERREAAERRVRELEDGLRPFASPDVQPHYSEPDHWPSHGKTHGLGWPTNGAFRRAAALLAPETPAPEPKRKHKNVPDGLPCPTCGFRIRTVEAKPFDLSAPEPEGELRDDDVVEELHDALEAGATGADVVAFANKHPHYRDLILGFAAEWTANSTSDCADIAAPEPKRNT